MAKSLINQVTGGGELTWSGLRNEIRHPKPTTWVALAILPVSIIAHFLPKPDNLWIMLVIPMAYLVVAVRSKSQVQRAIGVVFGAFWGIGILLCLMISIMHVRVF